MRHYKERCVTRYDPVTAEAASYDGLLNGFVEGPGVTMREEANLHRLWYDLRTQALFDPAFRADVADIDKSLEDMIGRIMTRFRSLQGVSTRMLPQFAYALFDGVFQQCLLKYLCGDTMAIPEMQASVRLLVRQLL